MSLLLRKDKIMLDMLGTKNRMSQITSLSLKDYVHGKCLPSANTGDLPEVV